MTDQCHGSVPADFEDSIPDIVALKEKYRQERDKRLRADGERQYVEMSSQFAHFYENDPYLKEPVMRAPINAEIDVAVIGGGFAGLMAGANLVSAGIDNIRIIEMGSDFGGTWYWNRYPGVQCDVDSYCYMPYLEQLDYVPKEKFSYGPEIFEQCRRIGRKYGLYDRVCFSTQVVGLQWDGAISRWRVSTNTGDDIRARFIIMGIGVLNRPKLPGIPGIERFKGHSFHTARWDYNYTGGDTHGRLSKLHDKRVAVVGSGSSGIQVIPHLGRDSEHLYVFQRTPPPVGWRGNRPTDPEWANSLKPGWQKTRRQNFSDVAGGKPVAADLICDGFTEFTRRIALARGAGVQMTPEEIGQAIELEDFKYMEKLRRRIDEVVERKDVAEILKPWYRWACKRPAWSDEFLPTFNRPNVTLVDVSASKGVEAITEKGLIANGVEYEVDCIVFATGFEVLGDFRRRYGFEVLNGRNGLSLYDHWRNGYRTFHGFMSHGFPNQFWTLFSQFGNSANIAEMLDTQTEHIAYIIKETLARGAVSVEPTEEAQDDWVATIRRLAVNDREFWVNCTPGFFNNEGGDVMRGVNGEAYAPGLNAFNELLKEWREAGTMAGMVLGTEEPADHSEVRKESYDARQLPL